MLMTLIGKISKAKSGAWTANGLPTTRTAVDKLPVLLGHFGFGFPEKDDAPPGPDRRVMRWNNKPKV